MVTMLQEHLGAYPDDVMLPEHTLNMYLAVVSVPVHESEASDTVPLRAGKFCDASHVHWVMVYLRGAFFV